MSLKGELALLLLILILMLLLLLLLLLIGSGKGRGGLSLGHVSSGKKKHRETPKTSVSPNVSVPNPSGVEACREICV